MINRLVVAVLLLAVVAGALMLSRGPGLPGERTATGAPAEKPGYSAVDAQVIETGDDGRPLYTLSAQRVRQHPNDNRVQLDAPRMTFVASDGNTWRASARSGQIREDGARIELFGDVRVSGQLSDRNDPIEVETSVLSFDTKTEVVSTNAPVLFGSRGRKLSGTGLVAKLPEHRFKLERIHGSFPPE